ncbi:MAG: glycosyltransferase [Melioribacteraceae bacterium]|nr:glycosyltransferase [Melioribacteraceae bacterium]
MDVVFTILLVSNSIFFLIVIYNLLFAPRVKLFSLENQSEKISVLIPARDEEKNITTLLNNLINQSYKNLEIIVLDDNSTDNTQKIVKSFSVLDNRIHLINGEKLQKGWLGKNFACHQLSQKANGDIFLFLDADVSINENSIESVLKIFKEKKVNMLSIFPTQIIPNISTYLITPMMNWILLTFLPLLKVYTSTNKSFVAANGQFIMIDKETYLKIGGHVSVKNKIVEDMELARKVKEGKFKIITLLGNNFVKCKMYSKLDEAFNGFSKNFYAGFNISTVMFSLLLIFIQSVFMLPTILVLFEIKFITIVFMIIISRIIISHLSNQNIFLNVLLHPFQMVAVFLVGINSMMTNSLGKLEWKGRKL